MSQDSGYKLTVFDHDDSLDIPGSDELVQHS